MMEAPALRHRGRAVLSALAELPPGSPPVGGESAPGHCGQNNYRVAICNSRLKALKHPHVLIV